MNDAAKSLEAHRVVEADFVAGATNAAQLTPPVHPEVAFAGRSNVGKSTTMNSLLQRRNLVRTSNTPGCTRQINIFNCRLADGLTAHLVDLPGYGYAKLSKAEKSTWGAMLEGYLLTRATLRAVVVLVDIRRGVEDDDRQLLEFLQQPRKVPSAMPLARFVVATKVDKLPMAQRKTEVAALTRAAGVPVLGFSGVTGEGREFLWDRLRYAILQGGTVLQT